MLPFRILANSPVQGTAANGMKRALGLLARRLPAYDAHIVATVHDQVLVEVKEELAHEVKDLVVATMKEGMQHDIKSVPIEVEAAIKKSWGG
jgi:DNA polymerase-1